MCDHDNASALVLINHPPKVNQCLFFRSCIMTKFNVNISLGDLGIDLKIRYNYVATTQNKTNTLSGDIVLVISIETLQHTHSQQKDFFKNLTHFITQIQI
jgi:hypothetical protein